MFSFDFTGLAILGLFCLAALGVLVCLHGNDADEN